MQEFPDAKFAPPSRCEGKHTSLCVLRPILECWFLTYHDEVAAGEGCKAKTFTAQRSTSHNVYYQRMRLQVSHTSCRHTHDLFVWVLRTQASMYTCRRSWDHRITLRGR
jgi:hypothetical protein